MACDANAAVECDAAAPIVLLVVEDSVVLRMSVAHYLRGSGYTVIESSNSQDALAVIASGIQIDLVFTDIQMPGEMDGIGLAEHLAREMPSLPVILTSGNPGVHVAPVGDTPRRFLRKPYELEDLEGHIVEFVGKACAAAQGLD